MAVLSSWDGHGVLFRTTGGVLRRLSARDLWDCAPAQFDSQTGQRTSDPLDRDDQPLITSVTETAAGWSVEFDPSGRLELGPEDIAPYLHPRAAQPQRRPWAAAPDQGWELFDYQAFRADDAVRRRCLS